MRKNNARLVSLQFAVHGLPWQSNQWLMPDLGVQSHPGAFSEEAERIYGQLRPGVRAGDATETAVEPGGIEGFRGISATQRAVRAERRLPERVAPRNPEGQTGPYTRETGSNDAGNGLLVLELTNRRNRVTVRLGPKTVTNKPCTLQSNRNPRN